MVYDLKLVALSILVSVVASYATLELILDLSRRRVFPWSGILGGALAFGMGIWSMHFIGMLAYRLPVPSFYDGTLTLLSCVLAIIASAIAILTAIRSDFDHWHLFLEASWIAAAISGMHYTGMAALQVAPPPVYSPLWVLFSLLIALVAADGALEISLYLRSHGRGQGDWKQWFGAVIMGLAICGMHYTAMAATRFAPDSHLPAMKGIWLLGENSLKIGVGSGMLVILAMSLYVFLNRPRPPIWGILLLVMGAELTLTYTVPLLFSGLSHVDQALLQVFLLGLYIIPVVYRLHLYQVEKREAQGSLQRYAETQEVLNRLLTMRVSQQTLQSLLEQALNLIRQVPWLPVLEQSGIFLYQEEKGVLELTVHKDLEPQLVSMCHRIKLGQCLCGQAGLTREIQHASCIDERHTHRFEGMAPHGHYNVPLMLDDKLVGVLVLYLAHGHEKKKEEVAFLNAYGSTLAQLIDRWRKSEMIQRLAFFDPLTKLANRTMLEDRYRLVHAQARRAGNKFALLFLDLDNFKTINDTLGHAQGDLLLKQVAGRLKSCVRESDTVARLGGDEFIILLATLESSAKSILRDVGRVAEKIIAEITKPVMLAGQEFHVGTSIGIACYPNDGHTLNKLLQAADTAMYQAKQQGRGQYQFYTQSMNVRLRQRLEIERVLRRALHEEQFYLFYQPQFDIATGRIVGAEALIRWNHPDKGELSPADFITIAENNGFIVALGEWVLRQACRQKARWNQGKLCWNLQHLAVNVSLRQLQSSNFIPMFERILEETAVKPDELELEVTESIFIRRGDNDLAKNLDQLKNLGIRLAMDDFGTGYSSLGRLKHFPIDTLKIDRSLIRDLTIDPNDASITRAIIALGHSLGMKVLAEGVETEEQFIFLRQLGCDWMQGFYAGRPMSARELVRQWSDNVPFASLARI